MLTLYYLLMLAALAGLTLLQTNRSMVVRSLGLLVILAVTVAYQLQAPGGLKPLLLAVMLLLCGLGFASDYYAASLRTWFFRVSSQAFWGLVIGGMIGLVFMNMFFSLAPFILGSLLGAAIGEMRERGFRSFTQVFKAMLGTFAGAFGMSLKLLLGIEMVYLFILYK